jgi:inhibitor of KinA
MEITPLGDSALLIRVAENFDESPERVLEEVLTAERSLRAAKIPGVAEVAPAYTTVAVFYDSASLIRSGAPIENVFGWLEGQIRDVLSKKIEQGDLPAAAIVEIPVCYDREFAFDLEEVAQCAGLAPAKVVDLHSGGDYRVHCIGFIGGFPFLAGLPKEIATPRRETPRKEIPVGSVGIGGKQTGIYPIKSPGGWNIIGRTPLPLFDAQQNPPVVLRVGDRVRFRPITRDEFERLTG